MPMMILVENLLYYHHLNLKKKQLKNLHIILDHYDPSSTSDESLPDSHVLLEPMTSQQRDSSLDFMNDFGMLGHRKSRTS